MNYSLTQVHTAILDAFKTRFPKVTVDSYDTGLDLSDLAPACLLDIEELPKAVAAEDGRYPVNARLAMHCVLGKEAELIQLEVREFALAVSQFVEESGYWVSNCTRKPTRISAMPGNFGKTTDGRFESWVVTWDQELSLGVSKWGDEEVRDGVSFAINPDDNADSSQFESVNDAPAY